MIDQFRRPLLVIPRPTSSRRQNLSGGASPTQFPSPARQRERIRPQLDELERAFQNREIELANDPSGAIPEFVLVLETVGTINEFMNAVRLTPELEWLGEWNEYELTADEDFFRDENHRDSTLPGQLLLIMTNQEALRQLRSLWQTYEQNRESPWPQGQTRWRSLFDQLRTIRPWDAQDRLQGTGLLEDWQDRVAADFERLRVEIELWYRRSEAERQRSQDRVEELVRNEGGRVVGQPTIISEIAYHGLVAELPIGAVGRMLEHQDTRLVRSDQVMFFRPIGQVSIAVPDDEPTDEAPVSDVEAPETLPPVVALLDGLPLQNHQRLAGRLIVDDPDNWATNYPPRERIHGTAMASLILHGELDRSEAPLRRPIYVRPVMQPDPNDWRDNVIREEVIPDTMLPIDLIHRAVRRLFDGDGDTPPVAPTIRIINISLGDRARQFDRFPSPWARLLDWLAWKYQVLFVVSSGNFTDTLVLDSLPSRLSKLPPSEIQNATLKAIFSNAHQRGVLAPSESINAITVGALHSDSSPTPDIASRLDPLPVQAITSPMSRVGPGFGRSIKPDILMPGGRQFYEVDTIGSSNTTFKISSATSAPGHRVAAPGVRPGDLRATRHLRGTSNAAALTSRLAAQLYETLDELGAQDAENVLDSRYIAVLLKAHLVHGARWGRAHGIWESILASAVSNYQIRDHVARYLGYGPIDPTRLYECTAQRATLLGWGDLQRDQAHVYEVPLPDSLSGKRVYRRLTITLAWLSPVRADHRLYRMASLWFDPPQDLLGVGRRESDWQTVRRGTIQHEVLEGHRATAYNAAKDVLKIQVNCKEQATRLEGSVPYGLLVTLETADETRLPIYDQIKARIRPAVRVTPTN